MQILRTASPNLSQKQVTFESISYHLEDGESIVTEWFPPSHLRMSKETPLVIFLVGIFGASRESYAREIAL